ncbi:uncharacterized protein [Phyllobates terribilis]|uniref:uncharacterized protein n=1 Tax=Phyllobates terribilis TaxID=111132 RepID=UPI003CCA9F42
MSAALEELLGKVRAAALVRGEAWLREKVAEILADEGKALDAQDPPPCAKRVRSLERRSPSPVPRNRRKVSSPCKDTGIVCKEEQESSDDSGQHYSRPSPHQSTVKTETCDSSSNGNVPDTTHSSNAEEESIELRIERLLRSCSAAIMEDQEEDEPSEPTPGSSSVPGSPLLVWILGNSYVHWGAVRADVRRDGRQLGISRDKAAIRWLGFRRMLWNSVLCEVNKFVRLDRPPDILLLHVGGNDLGVRPFKELIRDIWHDFLRLSASFPGMITVWSEIVPRKSWGNARSIESLNKARRKVNRAVSKFVSENGGVSIRHFDLENGLGDFWLSDGVHLNDGGIDVWSSALQRGIEEAIFMRESRVFST